VIPAEELVLGGGAPQYIREYTEPAYFKKIKSFDPASVPETEKENLKAVCGRTDQTSVHCFQKMDQCSVRQHGGRSKYFNQ